MRFPGPESRGWDLHEMQARDALAILSTVDRGRIAFTANAILAIRPVHHVVEGEDVLVRAAWLSAKAFEQVVAYEADSVDYDGVGWSVVIVGIAREVDDPVELARLRALLPPATGIGDADVVVRIVPELLTGYRLQSASAGSVLEPTSAATRSA